MDLFEEAARPPQLGFRLARLEVYNWGTFDGEVWTLDLAGATSLLTGDVGSGKSTLVDAIITLLVPPRRITYNKAADASAKARSLSSYVRGYYAHHSTAEGTSRPEALRDTREYSVILGAFTDEHFGRSATLARMAKPRSPVGAIASTSTAVIRPSAGTSASSEPTRRRAPGPSTSIKTPSASLRTNPARPNRRASP